MGVVVVHPRVDRATAARFRTFWGASVADADCVRKATFWLGLLSFHGCRNLVGSCRFVKGNLSHYVHKATAAFLSLFGL